MNQSSSEHSANSGRYLRRFPIHVWGVSLLLLSHCASPHPIDPSNDELISTVSPAESSGFPSLTPKPETTESVPRSKGLGVVSPPKPLPLSILRRGEFVKHMEGRIQLWRERSNLLRRQAALEKLDPEESSDLITLAEIIDAGLWKISTAILQLRGHFIPPWDPRKLEIEDDFKELERDYAQK